MPASSNAVRIRSTIFNTKRKTAQHMWNNVLKIDSTWSFTQKYFFLRWEEMIRGRKRSFSQNFLRCRFRPFHPVNNWTDGSKQQQRQLSTFTEALVLGRKCMSKKFHHHSHHVQHVSKAIRISQLRRHHSLAERRGSRTPVRMGMSFKWYENAALHEDVVLRWCITWIWIFWHIFISLFF